VTGLFLDDVDRLNDRQIALFDDILVHLTEHIEKRALAELGQSLATVVKPPLETVRRLANDDEITVARSVLLQSTGLSENDLVKIAKTKGQEHLLAISGRPSLTAVVTDVLVDRGNGQVFHTLAANSGASFSEFGFGLMVKHASSDSTLAEKLAVRIDIPLTALRQLLERATDLVRSRLLTIVSPEKRKQVQQMLETIASEVGQTAAEPSDFFSAETVVQQLNRKGKLNERVLLDFVRERKYEEMVAILALFCSAPTEFIVRLMKNVKPFGLLVACKAAKLSWPTVKEILQARFSQDLTTDQELADAKTTYIALSQATALRALRFMLVQRRAETV
jgi:uncharacterized protein (DUF2336 family)